jgi:hypothetical protein
LERSNHASWVSRTWFGDTRARDERRLPLTILRVTKVSALGRFMNNCNNASLKRLVKVNAVAMIDVDDGVYNRQLSASF